MIGELFSIFAVLTFVGSNVLFRKTEHEVSPTFINFFRTGIGTLTFIIIALAFQVFSQVFLLPWYLWLLLIISFIFGQIIGDTSFFTAQKDLGTTKALAISMTFPFFTFILSMIFLNRPFDFRIIISILLIGTGVIIIGKYKANLKKDISFTEPELSISKTSTNSKDKSKKFPVAIIYGLMASLGWAIGTVLIDFSTKEIDIILQMESLTSIIGNVIRFPFTLLILSSMVWREKYIHNKSKPYNHKKLSPKIWGWLMIASIIGTSLGAYLYTEAARISGGTFLALIASASPLFALPLDYLINREKLSKIGFLGVFFTIIGVVVILL